MMTLTVENFIKRLITPISDKQFRSIRYYGIYANRTRGQLLPIVYRLIQQKIDNCKQISIIGYQLIKKTFNIDPTVCPHGNIDTLPSGYLFPDKISPIKRHKAIALGGLI